MEPRQLALLYQRHAAGLVLYAAQRLDRAAAEDAVQEAFIRLMGQEAAPGNPKGWLFAAVRRTSLDAVRSGVRRRRREKEVAGGEMFEARPEDLVDAATVAELLGKLEDPAREVVVLRVWGGLTFQEIAEVAGLPLSTVHGEYRAGLQALRRRLEEPCRKRI